MYLIMRTKRSSGNFLKIYIDIVFCLCVCPFRLKLGCEENKEKLRYIIRSYWPQKICCALTTFLGFLWIARAAWDEISSFEMSARPGSYFEVVFEIVNVIQKLATLLMYWFAQQNFLAIVNFILNEHNGLAPDQMAISSPAAICLYLPYLIISVLGFTSGHGLRNLNSNSRWNFMAWWESVKCTSRYVYSFQDRSFYGNCAGNGTSDVIFGVLGIIGLFQRFAMHC